MKILVTGKNGFIAKNISKKLRKENFTVITSSRNPDNDLLNIEVGDLNKNTDWSLALGGIDVIIHLAARVHIIPDSR